MTAEDYEKRIASEKASIAEIKAHYKRESDELRRREAEELAVHQAILQHLRKERPRTEYFRKRYQKSRDAGLCASCGAPAGEYSHCRRLSCYDYAHYQSHWRGNNGNGGITCNT